jgi:hypothetical protein
MNIFLAHQQSFKIWHQFSRFLTANIAATCVLIGFLAAITDRPFFQYNGHMNGFNMQESPHATTRRASPRKPPHPTDRSTARSPQLHFGP